MCGILAILDSCALNEQTLGLITTLIDRRGPDYSSSTLNRQAKCGLSLKFRSSVLHLQGNVMQKQPVVDDNQNVFMYNGQVYRYNGQLIPQGKSDTTFLAEKLTVCRTQLDIVNVFANIDGPFAFVYWSHQLDTLFYGRDLFGRKSLCVLMDNELSQPKIISSVVAATDLKTSARYNWSEVDCQEIHCIDYSNSSKPTRSKFRWNLDKIYPRTAKCLHKNLAEHEVALHNITTNYLLPLNDDLRAAREFSDIERKAAIDSLGQKLIQALSLRIKSNLTTCLSCRKVNRKNVEARAGDMCAHSKVAVAFSGGIDSTLIAVALDKIIDIDETIDLVTVAFKKESPDRSSVRIAYNELRRIKPKRNWRLILCDISLDELKLTRDKHIKHLILPCNTVIDDSLGCACWFIGRARGRAVDSVHLDCYDPQELDNFLRYNTAKAEYKIPHAIYDYTSPASMLFVGSAIDEQLGGYSSHKSAWSASGLQGLHDEISFQMRRLPTRNLGRDDRNYSDHGRDLKIPYLDYEFVSFLNQLPVGLKIDLNEPMEIGPKKILRELAKDWGLSETSRRIKRAMQFGSRIANLEDDKEKGIDICSRLR